MRNLSRTHHFCIRSLIVDIFDIYFIGYWLCWFIVRYTRHSGHPILLINNWLTDFVFVPIVVHISLVFGHQIIHSRSNFRFSLLQILCFSIYTSLVFELLLPRITSYNTGDWLDVIMYFAGGLFYYFIHQAMYIKKRNHIRSKIS